MARKENRILKGGRNMNLIEVQGLKKGFGSVSVLTDVSFTVEKGDVIAVIGPSGAGKSTMLRCLIGLERVDGGSITVEGEPFVKNGVYASPADNAADVCQGRDARRS